MSTDVQLINNDFSAIHERMQAITLHTHHSAYVEANKLFSLANLVNMNPSDLMDEVERQHNQRET
jgi:hypothetical protein